MRHSYEIVPCTECGGPTIAARPICNLCQADEGLMPAKRDTSQINPPPKEYEMSHNINYAGLEGDAKRTTAMDDVKFWLGDQFSKINETAKSLYLAAPFDLETFRFSCMMVGIQGYPVEAWFEQIEAECKMVAVKGVDKSGLDVWYTGRADAKWVSPNREDAFMGYNLEGAKRKAEVLNSSSSITGITFNADI